MNKEFLRLGNLIFRISEITSLSIHTDNLPEDNDGWIIINKRTRIDYPKYEDAWIDYTKASLLLTGEDLEEVKNNTSSILYSIKD